MKKKIIIIVGVLVALGILVTVLQVSRLNKKKELTKEYVIPIYDKLIALEEELIEAREAIHHRNAVYSGHYDKTGRMWKFDEFIEYWELDEEVAREAMTLFIKDHSWWYTTDTITKEMLIDNPDLLIERREDDAGIWSYFGYYYYELSGNFEVWMDRLYYISKEIEELELLSEKIDTSIISDLKAYENSLLNLYLYVSTDTTDYIATQEAETYRIHYGNSEWRIKKRLKEYLYS